MPSANPLAELVESTVEEMRAKGIRVTTARLAIIEFLAASDDHPTVEQICQAVSKRDRSVHLATVYRTIEALKRAGLVEHLHLSHGPAVVRLAAMDHEHAVCDVCGAVTDIPASVFSALRVRIEREYGFQVGRQHFAMTGRCGTCDKRVRARSSR